MGTQVTKRVDTAEGQWSGWNWRTEGDMMVNGAFFVPSGEGMEEIYEKASSTDPKSSALVDTLTQNAGVLGDPRYARFPSPTRRFLVIDRLHSMASIPFMRERDEDDVARRACRRRRHTFGARVSVSFSLPVGNILGGWTPKTNGFH